MLKNSHRELIWRTVLDKLKIEKERQKKKSEVVDAYMDMIWEVLLTDVEKRIFLESPQRVSLTKEALRDNGFNSYYFLFTQSYYGLDLDFKEEYVSKDLDNFSYREWGYFYTSISQHQKYFKPFEITKSKYNYGKGGNITTQETELWIPDISMGIWRDEREKDEPGPRFVQRGECPSRYNYSRTSPNNNPKFYESEVPQVLRFTTALRDYIDLCRKVYRTIADIDIFLSEDPVTLTYLRRCFPELIEGIKFT